MIVCENSGHSVEDDFPELRKIFATMSSDEFKIGKKIPLLVMRRGIKCDI